MRSKEKAAHSVHSTESGAGNRISGPAVGNPDCNSTTGSSQQQGISTLLPHGEENAVSTKVLMELTGCTSARQLQGRISAERAKGALILATERGYFLPAEGRAGRQELHRFVRTMERRAAGTLKAAEPARAALAALEGAPINGEKEE